MVFGPQAESNSPPLLQSKHRSHQKKTELNVGLVLITHLVSETWAVFSAIYIYGSLSDTSEGRYGPTPLLFTSYLYVPKFLLTFSSEWRLLFSKVKWGYPKSSWLWVVGWASLWICCWEKVILKHLLILVLFVFLFNTHIKPEKAITEACWWCPSHSSSSQYSFYAIEFLCFSSAWVDFYENK